MARLTSGGASWVLEPLRFEQRGTFEPGRAVDPGPVAERWLVVRGELWSVHGGVVRFEEAALQVGEVRTLIDRLRGSARTASWAFDAIEPYLHRVRFRSDAGRGAVTVTSFDVHELRERQFVVEATGADLASFAARLEEELEQVLRRDGGGGR